MNAIRELYRYRTLVFFALASLLMQSCAPAMLPGQIAPLQPGTTQAGITAFQLGRAGTHFFTGPGNLGFVVFPIGDTGYIGGACLLCNGSDPIAHFRQVAGGQGWYGSGSTMSEFVEFLKSQGWVEWTSGTPADGRVTRWSEHTIA